MTSYKSLKLEPRFSRLNNIILNEPIDTNILNKLLNSDLLQVVNNPLSHIYYDNEKEQLMGYSELITNDFIGNIIIFNIYISIFDNFHKIIDY
jgi:hypothetical protein